MITVPMSASMYQAVVANLAGGDQQVQVIGTPIQLSSLQGIPGIVKVDPDGHHHMIATTNGQPQSGSLTITPVSGGHVSYRNV